MRQSHANWDSMVYPNWCNRIWCIHECHGRAAMSQMATVCNDWCEHLIYQYFSIAMAIWMCPMWLAFRMLELKRFHWLVIRPNHRWALLWFFSPSSSFPCELLCVWEREMRNENGFIISLSVESIVWNCVCLLRSTIRF